jgi:restriction endonuclease S subunit
MKIIEKKLPNNKNIERSLETVLNLHKNSANIIKNLHVECPVANEQRKIVDFLSKIDSKIDSATDQIIQTQSFKKGLLQQMFV